MVLKGITLRCRLETVPSYLDKYSKENIYDCVPILYSKRYNIHAFGLEKMHPFDATKYRRVFENLTAPEGILNLKKVKIHTPTLPSREFL